MQQGAAEMISGTADRINRRRFGLFENRFLLWKTQNQNKDRPIKAKT